MSGGGGGYSFCAAMEPRRVGRRQALCLVLRHRALRTPFLNSWRLDRLQRLRTALPPMQLQCRPAAVKLF